MNFEDLNISEPVLRALAEMGFTEATPIQEQAIPEILAGRDLIGQAQTGTGKSVCVRDTCGGDDRPQRRDASGSRSVPYQRAGDAGG